MYIHQLTHQLDINTTRVRVAQLPKTHNSNKTIKHNQKSTTSTFFAGGAALGEESHSKKTHFFLLAVTLN